MPHAPLQGFRDYLPPDAGARSALFAKLRAAARRAGFVEIETPSVESLELFTAKSGEEIVRELWKFRDQGERPVTLVAESTPSLARLFAERAKSEPLPTKWFNLARLWRYEEPQQGRTREFHQINLDILGVPGIEAEVDLLLTATDLLDSVGAAGLYEIRINDRPLVEGIGRALGATDLPRFFRALDRYRKLPPPERLRELAASGLAQGSVDRLVDAIESGGADATGAASLRRLELLDAIDLDEEATKGLDRLNAIFRLLGPLGVADRIVFDLTIVRGIAYYTSTVFEAVDRRGNRRSLLGGGRYDRLVELFGGPPTPAVGFAMGDQTLELLLREAERWPEGEPPLDTYVAAVTPEMVPTALAIVRELRASGRSADLDLLGRSLARQLKEANRRKARRAILVGPKELERGMVVERDLTTGAQSERPRSGVGGDAPPRAPA